MSTINEEKEQIQQESHILKTWRNAKSLPIKKFKDYLGPTGIWMIAYYFSAILVMICLNLARVGFSGEAIFAAPAYFAQLFLNYGLNAGKVAADDLDPAHEYYYQKIEFNRPLMSASWIFAPMIIYVLGMMFVFLNGSGYPQPEGGYDYLLNFRYFHDRTVLLREVVDGNSTYKTGGFYFVLVWLPIILASLIGAIVSRYIYTDKKTYKSFNVIKMMLFNLVAGFIIGYQMGYMTGTMSFSFTFIIKTLFTNNYEEDLFFFYSSGGQYHPHSIIITSWFINLITIGIAAATYLLYSPVEGQIVKTSKIIAHGIVYFFTNFPTIMKNFFKKISETFKKMFGKLKKKKEE